VLDTAGTERAVLLCEGADGGGLEAMYAATFPADAGEHGLKGVPDRWHLYRVVA